MSLQAGPPATLSEPEIWTKGLRSGFCKVDETLFDTTVLGHIEDGHRVLG